MPVLNLKLVGGDLKKLRAEGCKAAADEVVFRREMKLTRDNLCESDCDFFDSGRCPAYQKYHTRPIKLREEQAAKRKEDYERSYTDQSGLIGGIWAGMSIRQIAQKEGISLNKAREFKRMGRYKGNQEGNESDATHNSIADSADAT